jgi:hypothetical protein
VFSINSPDTAKNPKEAKLRGAAAVVFDESLFAK